MITLNEEHNMEAVLENLGGFAQEIFLVDSYSRDATVDIALKHGVHVVQRRFRDFGDQWNFALSRLPITAPWTMKLDPDERLTDELKASIREALAARAADGFSITRRLWFMGRPLPVRQNILRLWKTGACRFSDVLVNEHPIVNGRTITIKGDVEHHDSPNLDHWFAKQNSYTSYEALAHWRGGKLSAEPKLFGTALERRMWIKATFTHLPFSPTLIFLYYLMISGVWKTGRVGIIWALLRRDVHRMIIYKRLELELSGRGYEPIRASSGEPDLRVPQCD
jgi:glycosyltransferase involved in cell wall biosynthesis